MLSTLPFRPLRPAAFGRVALLLGALLLLPSPAADAGGGAHPYFHDGGALTWFTHYADACRAAAQDGKLVFIEYGRQRCTNCRRLASEVLAERGVRARIGRIAIGLAAECDQPERAVSQILYANLRNPRVLPFVGFVTPEGRWVTGFCGGIHVAGFQAHLARAEREHARWTAAARRPAPRAGTPVAPRPAPAARDLPGPVVTRPGAAPAPAAPPCAAEEELPQHYSGEEHCDLFPEDCCPGGQCAPPPCMPLSGLLETPDPAGPTPTPTPARPDPAPPTAAWPPPAPDAAPRVAQPTEVYPAPVHAALPPPTALEGSPDAPAGPAAPAATPAAAAAPEADAPAAPALAHARAGAARAPLRAAGATRPQRAGSGAYAQLVREAEEAARAEDWGEVIRYTRDGTQEDERLDALNRLAHRWAHDQLAAAVRAVERGEYAAARALIEGVARHMRGEPEGVDAERGLEAVETVQHLGYLPGDSAVRKAVRRSMYEKMRGTRWAPLFSSTT